VKERNTFVQQATQAGLRSSPVKTKTNTNI